MKSLSLLDLVHVWAAITGLLLAAGYFAALYFGIVTPPMLAMLVTGIGGFELFLFLQDAWLKRSGRLNG